MFSVTPWPPTSISLINALVTIAHKLVTAPPTREMIEGADVVLAIGTELAETDYDITFQGHFKIPGTLLRIDIDPDQTVPITR